MLKEKRVKNNGLLNLIRALPCWICKYPPRSEAHHVHSRGAGGGDLFNMVIPLCTFHHREIHNIGTNSMAEKYNKFKEWLINHHWYYCEVRKTWRVSFY